MPFVARVIAVLCLLASPLAAQAAPSVAREVQAFVRAYVDAANRGDASAYAAMYKNSAELIVINDGELKRGWASIRDEANAMMGKEGAYKISPGIVDVLPLGATRAVAVFPFVGTVQTEQGLAQFKSAMTLVLEKSAGKWVIVHDHTSSVQAAAQ